MVLLLGGISKFILTREREKSDGNSLLHMSALEG